jgi:hypothetical protein
MVNKVDSDNIIRRVVIHRRGLSPCHMPDELTWNLEAIVDGREIESRLSFKTPARFSISYYFFLFSELQAKEKIRYWTCKV